MTDNWRRWARATWPLLVASIAAIGAIVPRSPALLPRAQLNSGYAHLNHALTWGHGSDFADAEAMLNRVALAPSLNHQAERGLGLLYMSQSRPDAAIQAWQTVEGIIDEVRLWGERAERVHDYATASQWYRVAVRMEPRNGDHWYRLAHASAELGDAKAHDQYLRALSAPHHSEYGLSNILTRLGELEKGAGDPDWAMVLDRFTKALEQDDFTDLADVSAARLGRAEALERLGQYSASLAEYRQLIDLEPGLYWANVHGGRLIWYVERDAEAAITLLRRAIAINDDFKWAYLNLGLVYAGSGRPDMALPLFQQVLAIDPNDQEARTQLELLTNHDS